MMLDGIYVKVVIGIYKKNTDNIHINSSLGNIVSTIVLRWLFDERCYRKMARLIRANMKTTVIQISTFYNHDKQKKKLIS